MPYSGNDPGLLILTQLHSHTTSSDGSYAVSAVVSDYNSVDTEVLAITDHDLITIQTSGIDVAIPGNELSPSTVHILSINCDYERGAETDPQTLIDNIILSGGDAIIAHPNWSVGISYGEMSALTNYLGLEIHNAVVVGGAGGDSPITYPGYAINEWDKLLTNVRQDIWGFASDDLHDITAYRGYDIGRLQLFVPSINLANVLSAIDNGNFVADVSNYGVTPGWPVVSSSGVDIDCPGATSLRFIGKNGSIIQTIDDTSASYNFRNREQYVRIEAVGDYTESFSADIDQTNRWGAVNGTWVVSAGILSQTNNTDVTTGYYLNLKRHVEDDWEVIFDVKINTAASNRQGGMVFRLDNNRFYYVRVSKSAPNADTVSLWHTLNGAFSAPYDTPLAYSTFTVTLGSWIRVKINYTKITNKWQIRVWNVGDVEPESWNIDIIHTGFSWGYFGFRCRCAQDFDNLYIKGFKTYYQPIFVTSAEDNYTIVSDTTAKCLDVSITSAGPDGWLEPEFDDSLWTNAVIAVSSGTQNYIPEDSNGIYYTSTDVSAVSIGAIRKTFTLTKNQSEVINAYVEAAGEDYCDGLWVNGQLLWTKQTSIVGIDAKVNIIAVPEGILLEGINVICVLQRQIAGISGPEWVAFRFGLSADISSESLSPSESESASGSLSESPSDSDSISPSESESGSKSESKSESASGSLSESKSESASPSPEEPLENRMKIVYISPDFATSGISILEKIHRLNDLQDPDLMDVEHLQYFANNLGYNVNINRGELGNLAEYVTSATCPDIETEKYLRFAIRNLPFWYRIKTTHNAVKIMLYSFGLIGDISQYYTDNYLPESEGGKWVTEDINQRSYSLSAIPNDFYPTPHFIVWVNLDLSTANLSWQYEKRNEIVNAIESIKPANTVFRKLGGYTKIPINLYVSLQTRFHSRYIKLSTNDINSDYWVPILIQQK